tara:strand:- start:89222 stop:90796 length:1575 start_codon:yes stop_codon:yes gene_type:complete
MLITGSSPYANEIGQKIAADGGNVVDVAVAVGAAMAVTNPYNASLGGGGFALVRFNGKVHVLDFREIAPRKTNEKYYLDKGQMASRDGGHAIGVPGYPAGLVSLHAKFGKLPWKNVIRPAVQLAKFGFRIGGEWHQRTKDNKGRLNKAGKGFFFKRSGHAYNPGQKLKQKELSRALSLFRYSKKNGFYTGSVADDIVSSVKESGGVISYKDLRNYKVRWLKPITTEYEGHTIHMMPPPSSGGVVIKTALSLIEKLNLKNKKPLSSEELHLLAEIESRAFRGRLLLGDPDFHQNPMDLILSKKYLNEMASSITPNRATQLAPLKEMAPVKESTETTHFTVMDRKGNAVSLTVTLNGAYGSGVVTDRYGIVLNNEMDDFTTHPDKPNMFGLIQGRGNLVQPGKRPLSSMTPTIVTKGNETIMALGAPGGPKIISSVLQVLYRTLSLNFDMDKAIQYPRVHHQFLPNKLFVYSDKHSPDVLSKLKTMGHNVVEHEFAARVNGIRRDPKTGFLEAAFDSRAEGSVAGY